MRKPIIGIVARPHTTYTEREAVCVFDDYRRAISNAGGIPILIIPTQDVRYEITRPKDTPSLTESEKEDLITQIKLCDGILLPGGNRMYEYDKFICDYAIKNKMNILGICLGMQVLACVDTNESRDNVLQKIESDINHHQKDLDYVHSAIIDKNSYLYKILGKEEIKVNSRHKFSVIKTNKLNVIAKSKEDEVIEAIENMEDSFVLGLQWHPESMQEYDENMRKIMREFISVCKSKED